MAEGSAAEATDVHALARSLAPMLIDEIAAATGCTLCEIEWFRSAWQRGGAATGFANLSMTGAGDRRVFVKLPIGPKELHWTTALGGPGLHAGSANHACVWDSPEALASPAPRVVACGRRLGSHDLAWAVTECCDGDPIGSELAKHDVTEMIRAAARFQQRALEAEAVGARPASPDWDATIEKSRERIATCGIAEPQRWNEALRRAQKLAPMLQLTWAARPVNAWCHGDLHPGNAMRRAGGDGLVLIDLAEVQAGHWIEDGLYLERLFWGRGEKLHKIKPVSALARERRALDLPCDDGYAELANAWRVLRAACVPANLPGEGDATYCGFALELLERLLSQSGA